MKVPLKYFSLYQLIELSNTSIIEFHQLQTYGVPVDLGKPGLGLHRPLPPPLLRLGGRPHHNSLL